jgi:hypothetical protein
VVNGAEQGISSRLSIAFPPALVGAGHDTPFLSEGVEAGVSAKSNSLPPHVYEGTEPAPTGSPVDRSAFFFALLFYRQQVPEQLRK